MEAVRVELKKKKLLWVAFLVATFLVGFGLGAALWENAYFW